MNCSGILPENGVSTNRIPEFFSFDTRNILSYSTHMKKNDFSMELLWSSCVFIWIFK
jgi:hypothetical protein